MGRETYRHGDLHRALLDAALELARLGGPDAISLREVTRRAQVAPSAAYRHFANREALQHEVSMAAQAKVAAAMEQERELRLSTLAKAVSPAAPDAATVARVLLRAVGAGYLRFAWQEPGWFRAAFWVHRDLQHSAAAMAAGPQGRSPYQLLSAALDAMVAAQILPVERRPGAEALAWSTVHGMAVLMIDGPLRAVDDATRRVLAERLLTMVENGL